MGMSAIERPVDDDRRVLCRTIHLEEPCALDLPRPDSGAEHDGGTKQLEAVPAGE